MTVAQGVALLVAYGLQKLVYPDGGVDGEALAVQRGEIGGARTGLEDLPEAVDTHDEGVSMRESVGSG